MLRFGNVCDKNGNPVNDAIIEVKNEQFSTVYNTMSDENGCYSIDLPAGKYPFIIAIKDYGVNFLEFWCQNINIGQDTRLDVRFDTLEIYGLHVFGVKGAFPSLMVYFRPMSLGKYKSGETDICPEIKSLRVYINEKEVPVLKQNSVLEYCGDRDMNAYLVQTALPDGVDAWERLDIEIRDADDAFGMATIFAER